MPACALPVDKSHFGTRGLPPRSIIALQVMARELAAPQNALPASALRDDPTTIPGPPKPPENRFKRFKQIVGLVRFSKEVCDEIGRKISEDARAVAENLQEPDMLACIVELPKPTYTCGSGRLDELADRLRKEREQVQSEHMKKFLEEFERRLNRGSCEGVQGSKDQGKMPTCGTTLSGGLDVDNLDKTPICNYGKELVSGYKEPLVLLRDKHGDKKKEDKRKKQKEREQEEERKRKEAEAVAAANKGTEYENPRIKDRRTDKGSYTYLHGKHVGSNKHNPNAPDGISVGPIDGQRALDNSVEWGEGDTDIRVGISEGEIVALYKTLKGEFHGFVISFDSLPSSVAKKFIDDGKLTPVGKMIKNEKI